MIAVETEPRTLDVSPTPPAHVKAQTLPWLVLGLSAVAFGYGVTTIRTAAYSQYGLLASASPAYALSILLAALGFTIAIRRSNIKAAIGATILMILVQRLPASVSTDVPMYSWTYKHLGVVDYIQHEHALAHGVDIYQGWPGLFALTAWFSDLTGVRPITIAHWFPVCFHLGFALIVYAMARAWGLEWLNAVTAVFIVASLNWVLQDYYSPQATVMLLTAAVLIPVGLSQTRPLAVPLIILLFAADTITHQLTPLWVFIALGILVVSRKLKPWWIVIPLAVILLAFWAYNIDQIAHNTEFTFNLFDNAKSNIRYSGSVGQRVTSFGDKVLATALWLATTVTLVARWRKKQPFWCLGVLALSPMVILLGQNYGGEAIFRVFLYSLLGCSLVLAPVVVSTLQRGLARYLCGVLAVITAVVLAAQGYFGAWLPYVMTQEEVAAAHRWLERADFPSYVSPADIVWPQRSTWRYVDFARFNEHYDDPIVGNDKLVGLHFNTDEDYKKFNDVIAAHWEAPTYVIFTEQLRLYTWYFGMLPLDAFPNLEARMAQDPSWRLVDDVPGVRVYEHRVEMTAPGTESGAPRLGDTS